MILNYYRTGKLHYPTSKLSLKFMVNLNFIQNILNPSPSKIVVHFRCLWSTIWGRAGILGPWCESSWTLLLDDIHITPVILYIPGYLHPVVIVLSRPTGLKFSISFVWYNLAIFRKGRGEDHSDAGYRDCNYFFTVLFTLLLPPDCYLNFTVIHKKPYKWLKILISILILQHKKKLQKNLVGKMIIFLVHYQGGKNLNPLFGRFLMNLGHHAMQGCVAIINIIIIFIISTRNMRPHSFNYISWLYNFKLKKNKQFFDYFFISLV